MNFLIVDDMNIILEAESRLLKEIMPECQVCACTDGADALLHAKEEVFHVAFLDIELGVGKPDGIMLAKQLKDLQPQLHIIFVTAYQSYAVEAFSIHATGYLLKPIQKERMKQELTFLYQEDCISEKRIKVRTFGNFEVWVDGRQLNFGRQKSKELFAYLVDRKGSGVTTREACAVLFEDGVYNLSRKSNFQNIVADMRNTFKKLGLEGVIKKQYNYLAVDTDKLDCDYYRFLNGDVKVINQYNGEFMTNYSWAEFDAPMFSHKF